MQECSLVKAGTMRTHSGSGLGASGFGGRRPEAGCAFTRVRNRGEERESGKGKEGTTQRRWHGRGLARRRT